MSQPTPETYNALTRAFNLFNRELFDDELPPCLITYQRHKNAYGYFHGSKFAELDNDAVPVDEIALNPATFHGRSRREILSTLAHEMCHLWQHHHGHPSRNGYHNKEWAGKMQKIGLEPSDTGKPGGKPTGRKVSHYIVKGDRFDKLAALFTRTETLPLFKDRDSTEEKNKPTRPNSKTRYTCPACEQHAWAKPDAKLICGECAEAMVTDDELPEAQPQRLIDILGGGDQT